MVWKVMDAGGTLRTVTSLKINDSGVLRSALRVKVMDEDGTTLRTVAEFIAPLSVTMSASDVVGYAYGSGTAVTDSVTATPVGGLAPYTYSWARTSGAGSIGASTAATTSFYQYVPNGTEAYGAFRVTVTDANGNTATGDVFATYTSIDGGFL